MEHPFKNKLIVFIGTPLRCTRKEARNELLIAGGIPDEAITAHTDFVVAFSRADGTKAYIKAVKNAKFGLLSILTEEQFFNILEGKAQPPEKPKRDRDVIVIPSANAEAETLVSERFMEEHLNRKRINSMARHGVPTPEGQVKIDMRMLEKSVRVARYMKEKEQESE